MKVRDMMSTNVVTVTEDTLVNDAKKIMEAHRIRRLPVMKKDKLVGVVTESDIVRMMTRVLGVRDKGKRIDIRGSAQFGNMKRIMDILDSRKTVLLSMMTLPPEQGEIDWLVMLRVRSEDAEPIARELEISGFKVTYVG